MTMTLKSRLAEPGRMLSCQLAVIPTPVVTQMIAASGTDMVIIDQEHGPIGIETLHAMIAATQGSDCAPLVRIPEICEATVKRALDAGAEGICFPMIRSAADAERAVATLRYPPHGKRGWGPFVAQSRWQVPMADYAAEYGDKTVCMILIETVDALNDIDAICAVDGLDCVVIAPFDLSTDLGVPGQMNHPKMQDAVARIEAAVLGAGLPLGGIALNADQVDATAARGYRVLVGFDVFWLKAALDGFECWVKPD